MGYLMVANIRSFTLNIIMVFKIFMRSLLSRIISNDIIIYLIAEVNTIIIEIN